MSRRELLQWRIITVLLLTAQIAPRNRKMFEKYLELANVRCFPFPQDNNANNKILLCCGNIRTRAVYGIMDCSLSPGQFKCQRHTRICSVHFEGGPGLTKLNPVPSIFAFPQHLQRKPPKSRPTKEAHASHGNTTQTLKNKVFTSRKKTQDFKP